MKYTWEEIVRSISQRYSLLQVSQTSVKMENIPLKEQKISNDCFAITPNPMVVEFEIENFDISEFNAENQTGSHAYLYPKLSNLFPEFQCKCSFTILA